MNNRVCLSLASALLGALAIEPSIQASPVANPALSSTDRAALSAASRVGLSDLRAGVPATLPVVRADERAALKQAASPNLCALRAGDLSGGDLGVVLIVLGVAILILVLS